MDLLPEHRFHRPPLLGMCQQLGRLVPGEEPTGRIQVRRPGVLVADGGGEKFQEASRGPGAGVGDDRRQDDLGRDGAAGPQRLVGREDGQRAARF
jgi:hypothetical protein